MGGGQKTLVKLISIVIFHSKVTTEAQLGLIGGTMGLLTGFSILSGVEIIYHLIRFFQFHISKEIRMAFFPFRFFMSLRLPRAEVVSSVNNKYGNHLMRK